MRGRRTGRKLLESSPYLNNNLVTPGFPGRRNKDCGPATGCWACLGRGFYTRGSLEYRRIYKNQVRWMKAIMYPDADRGPPGRVFLYFCHGYRRAETRGAEAEKAGGWIPSPGFTTGRRRWRVSAVSLQHGGGRDKTAALIMLDLDDFRWQRRVQPACETGLSRRMPPS